VHESRFRQVPATDCNRTRGIGAQPGHDLVRTTMYDRAEGVRNQTTERDYAHAGHRAACDDGAEHADPAACDQHATSPATAELITIPPGCELGTQRRTDPHQLRSVRQSAQADVLGGYALPRRREQPRRLFDGLPPLLERSEVPPLAPATDDPQSALATVEREAPADGKVVQRLVATEVGVAEETGRIHETEYQCAQEMIRPALSTQIV